jgi:hypothetical protein
MKFEITVKQINYYKVHKELAFEQVLDSAVYALISGLTNRVNLWRISDPVKIAISGDLIGQIIHELAKKKPIRILYDAVIEQGEFCALDLPFQGALMTLVVPLDEEVVNFVAADKPVLISKKSYIVVYGEANSRFMIREEKSEFVAEMKKMGYASGDKLKQDEFPFIYK